MTQSSKNSKTHIKSGYGIESGRSYNADEVAALLAIAEEEAEASIQQAYAEGYKAGLLEAAPESARLAVLNEQLKTEALRYQTQLETQKQLNRALIPLFIVLGDAAGFAIRGIK
ncbi:MAG: hypothetical protein IJL34_10945 [Treponema sp.]|nr:hypothetical protein [Treponema sp.]